MYINVQVIEAAVYFDELLPPDVLTLCTFLNWTSTFLSVNWTLTLSLEIKCLCLYLLAQGFKNWNLSQRTCPDAVIRLNCPTCSLCHSKYEQYSSQSNQCAITTFQRLNMFLCRAKSKSCSTTQKSVVGWHWIDSIMENKIYFFASMSHQWVCSVFTSNCDSCLNHWGCS